MSNPLFPCPVCMRHVRVGVAACPFCRAALPAEPEGLVPAVGAASLTRAALFAFATSVASCAGSQATTTNNAPPTDPSVNSQTTTSTSTVVQSPPVVNESSTTAPAYGAPPEPEPMTPDAGTMVADATVSDAPAADAHHADASRPQRPTHPAAQTTPHVPARDPGAMMVRYGAPPAGFA